MNDVGTERSVLAGLVQYGYEAYIEISDILNIKCFTTDLNKIIYRCVESVLSTNENVDIALIYSSATTLGYEKQIVESTEAANFLRALYAFPIDKESLRTLTEKIVKLQIARDAQNSHKIAYDKLSKITGEEPVEDILAISEEPYSSLLHNLNGEDDIKKASHDIDDYYSYLINKKDETVGIPSPFKIWNYSIGNLRTGVHLVAARFKVGKSTIAKETAIHTSLKLGIPTLYIDTEMSKQEQDDRILAGFAKVPIDEIATGSFRRDHAKRNRVEEAVETYKKMNYFHKNVAGQGFQSILSQMARWIHKDVGIVGGVPNPHLIIYDYFKLMDAGDLKDMKEYQVMGFQIAALHDFCQKYQTPVLSFVQINRDGIDKDSTDIIAQSDRLGWNAVSISIYRRKAMEEIAEDGIENGNMKMLPLEGRFMKKLDDGDYINMSFQPEYSLLTELKTRNMLKSEKSQ